MAKKIETEKPLSFREEIEAIKKELNRSSLEDIYLNTGSLALDIALGGKGWKLGRQASLVAWFGAGKTTLCIETVAQAEKRNFEYAYIDGEHSLDESYIKKLGINWDRFNERLFQPSNGEEAFEIAKRLIKTGELRLLIFDSVSGMLPKKMMEDAAGTSSIGLHARLFSSQVPVLHELAAKYNCLIIYVNQIREKIGVMFGSPETTQAGNAIPFFDDYRIEIRKTIEKENGDKEDATGVTSRFKVIKNKVAPPYKTGEYSIVFGEGINKVKEIIDIAIELELIKVWGKKTTYPNNEEGTVYETETFPQFLKDNPEFTDILRSQIQEKLQIQ